MITGVKIVAYAEQNEREESPMTHTPDQIRRAEMAQKAYTDTFSFPSSRDRSMLRWLAVAEAVEADVHEQEDECRVEKIAAILARKMGGPDDAWLDEAQAVVDALRKEGPEGRWVKCDDAPAHYHSDGTRWRDTRIVGGAWEGREHWEPATPPDPHVAAVTDWASSLGLADESVRDLLARLDAAKEG